MYVRCHQYFQRIAPCAGLSSLREYEETKQAGEAKDPSIQVRILHSFSYYVRFLKNRILIHVGYAIR
jgi:hypothetical protein